MSDLTPEAMQARVLYRDAMLLVFNKPSGIAVHAGPKLGRAAGDNLERYFDALRYGLPRPPGLVHRLDRDTSGCLVLGRHRQALKRGGELFAQGKAEKIYLAICAGIPEKRSGTINASLRKKNDQKAGWEMIVVPDAAFEGTEGVQTAVTTYRTLSVSRGESGSGSQKPYSLVEFRPKTGRTHQIRIHAAHSGFPLIGDPRYFEGLSEDDRRLPFCLHALSITLPFYNNKPPIRVEAPLPDRFQHTLDRCGLAFRAGPDSAAADAP